MNADGTSTGDSDQCAEFRRIQHGGEYRDEFALATEWKNDGTPDEYSTAWRGYKGDFFDLFYAVNQFAEREFPELFREVVERNARESSTESDQS